MAVLPFVLAALVAAGPRAPAADTAGYSPRDAAAELPSLVVVDSGRYGYSLDLDTAGARGALGALARANRHYVLCLTLNAPGDPLAPAALVGDQRTVRRNVLRRLADDSAYLATLVTSVARHRAAASGSAAPPPRAVRAARVRDVAARFFYPDEVLPDGRIRAHVCVGINGVADMQGGRDLAVEAFAYAAIFHDLLAPADAGYDVGADYQEAKRLINAMDLSTDAATRLRRAQGVMWAVMLRSEKMRQVLAAECRRARGYLPFAVDGAPGDTAEAARW